MMVRKALKQMLLQFFSGTAVTLITIIVLTACQAVPEGPAGQKSFTSLQNSVTALVDAVQNNNDAELLAILGPDSGNLISSGDKIADQKGRTQFLKAYKEKNHLEQESKDRAVLYIGSTDYPFPIPIVRQENTWIFDTPAGLEEILNRRIGRYELHTIEVMQEYTAAQREYACLERDGGGSEFAQYLASTEGKKNGLYWDTKEGEDESPFGPLIAIATEEGYLSDQDKNFPDPFRGYYFKILKAQGEHALGGPFDYVADGKMVLGFALVAYPAKYGASGVITFIVNQEGVIYEKDLGKDTAATAVAMTTFNPDDTWSKYEEPVVQ